MKMTAKLSGIALTTILALNFGAIASSDLKLSNAIDATRDLSSEQWAKLVEARAAQSEMALTAANKPVDPKWSETTPETMKDKGWTKHTGPVSKICYGLGEKIAGVVTGIKTEETQAKAKLGIGYIMPVVLNWLANNSVISCIINDENRHWVACALNEKCEGIPWNEEE